MLTTSALARDVQYISHYTDSSFTIAETCYQHAVLILDTGVVKWQVSHVRDLHSEAMQALVDTAPAIIVIGSGRHASILPQDVYSVPLAQGIGLEIMATRSACRCYNILLEEGRRVTAALLPAGTV